MNIQHDYFNENVNTQTITVIPNPPRALRAVHLGSFLLYSFALVILTIVVFAALKLLGVQAGQMIDWTIGLVSFWWLLAIVTVPWNIRFQARETLIEAAMSRERGIALNEKQIEYVRRVARRSLVVAIALHIFSAIALFALAITGISPVGYVGFVFALLLTALRPGIRGYEYLWTRLAAIRGQILHPREDVVELRGRFTNLESQVKNLIEQLNESKLDSWANQKAKEIRDLHDKLNALKISYELSAEQNEKDHQRMARETERAVAQLAADSQFLDNVREIIRFIKTA
jgi:hypothetical protein